MAPGGAAGHLINCLKRCHLSQRPLGMKISSLKIKKSGGVKSKMGSKMSTIPALLPSQKSKVEDSGACRKTILRVHFNKDLTSVFLVSSWCLCDTI